MARFLLQYKILFGYILLMIIIGCMAAVLLHERHRIREIEEDANAIRLVRREINNIHRHITDLALSGELVMTWEQADYESYHEDRLDVDTLLQTLLRSHDDFVLSEQIDTLRNLLAYKETHLLHIMEATIAGNRRQPAASPSACRNRTSHKSPLRYQKEKRYCRIFRKERDRTDSTFSRCQTLPERTSDNHTGGAHTQHRCIFGQPPAPKQGTEPQTAHAD